MASNFSINNGNKFADGTRTLQYSKIVEPIIVNTIDTLNNDFSALKNDTNNRIYNLENKMNNLGNETARIVNETKYNLQCQVDITRAQCDMVEIHLNMLLWFIWNIINIWPMRFLNWIFKWWTFQIINEERTKDGNEYIFYTTIILRGTKSRKGMRNFTAVYKQRIADVKKCMDKKHEKVKLIIKPIFPTK